MEIFLYTIFFMIGAILGSFFTLAVYRIPIGQDITHERSYCPKCNHKLGFLDLIPVLSYIFLGGKCRYCKDKIRPRYLILEILSGITVVLFVLSVKINIFQNSIHDWIYVAFGIIYISVLFILAGIDKERITLQKSVFIVGLIDIFIYIIYLYIINVSIYRYVIYLILMLVLIIVDTYLYKTKLKDSYTIQILMLCIYMILFTGRTAFILTAIFTLICIAIKSFLNQKNNENKMPIVFYLSVSNVIAFIISNFIAL